MIKGGFGRLSDPAASFVITGARVVDPGARIDEVGEVAVADGTIVALAPRDAERIDGSGLVVAPGLCDLHAHLREPGTDGAETVASGARAAAHGGYTTVCAMPNTIPPLDEPHAVAAILASDEACRVRVIAAASRGRAGMQAADLESLAAVGAVGFSDDGASVSDALARPILAELARLGLPLIEHAEDPALADGVMRAGSAATRLGLPGWLPAAEVATVERDIALAEELGARLHLTHVSTTGAVAAVRAAKKRGVAVTCDVTPHHLVMADDWVAGRRSWAWDEPGDDDPQRAYDGSCRVNPPLASREEAAVLLAAVADGTIDAIATDHAPHPPERKAVPFGEAAPGLIGLETALSLGLAAVEAGRLTLASLLAALSSRPAEVIGEARTLAPGTPADLVVFDPRRRWHVEAAGLASASANTPLLGMELPGVVLLTVAGGRVTYRSEAIPAGMWDDASRHSPRRP